MSGHDIIVVGASAGGVEVLSTLISNFPADLPAAVFVVLHIAAQGKSVLPDILNRSIQKRNRGSSLQACQPQDGQAIQHGRIYVAPPNQHLLLKDGYIRLAHGPKENSHRPAVDPLFRTAAKTYGPRVVGVVLSGTLDDGTAGLLAVKQRGGVAVVQNPDEALFSGMPKSAIENVDVDYILPVSDMATVLVDLAYKPLETPGVAPVSSEMEMESDIAELELAAMQSGDRPGKPSGFGCPECGGSLWEIQEGKLIRFRCRTGHAYSINTLLAEQSSALEEALWASLRALEERAALSERMANRARDRNQNFTAERFNEQQQSARQQATLVRGMLLNGAGNGELSTVNRQVVGEASSPQFVVAFAASAGEVQALTQVLSALSADFPAAIIIVQHLHHASPLNGGGLGSPLGMGEKYARGWLTSPEMASILSRHTTLTVKEARAGDSLCSGTVYIAPLEQHLLVNADKTLCLTHSELVHFVRPSVDLLFESVATIFKQRSIAVVLIGTGSDGGMGVRAIKEMGGKTIAQERDTCEVFEMPKAAIETESVDWVLPLDEISATLMRLVSL